MALAQLDEAEQARGRCFVAAAALWFQGGISAKRAWEMAAETERGNQREVERGNRRTYVSFEGARHAYEGAVQAEQRIEAERAAAPPALTTPTPD